MIKLTEIEKWRYENKDKVSVSTYLSKRLDGTDHENGQIETIQDTANNVHEAFCNLVELLESKKILSEKEIKKMVQDIY